MNVDLHKLALRFKVLEMIKAYTCQRQLREAPAYWRRLICPN